MKDTWKMYVVQWCMPQLNFTNAYNAGIHNPLTAQQITNVAYYKHTILQPIIFIIKLLWQSINFYH